MPIHIPVLYRPFYRTVCASSGSHSSEIEIIILAWYVIIMIKNVSPLTLGVIGIIIELKAP